MLAWVCILKTLLKAAAWLKPASAALWNHRINQFISTCHPYSFTRGWYIQCKRSLRGPVSSNCLFDSQKHSDRQEQRRLADRFWRVANGTFTGVLYAEKGNTKVNRRIVCHRYLVFVRIGVVKWSTLRNPRMLPITLNQFFDGKISNALHERAYRRRKVWRGCGDDDLDASLSDSTKFR